MEVRSGHLTSFWYDDWCPLGRLFDTLGPRGTIDLGIPQTATVAEVLNEIRTRRHRSDFLNQVEQQIEAIRLRTQSEAADRSLWKYNPECYKSKFSSQQTWRLIRAPYPICTWSRGVWFANSTPKYSFVVWLAFRNRLATGDRMLKWNTNASVNCVLCGAALETRNHLFFTCTYSSQVWYLLTKGILHNSYTSEWRLITSILLDTSQSHLQRFTLRYVFQISIHSLWRERNCRRHGEAPLPAPKLSKLIDKEIRNKFSSLRQMGKTEFEAGYCFWLQSQS